MKAFSEVAGAAFTWDARRHRQMMIASTEDSFSPVTAALESGMALLAPSADVPPHPWTLIQGGAVNRQAWLKVKASSCPVLTVGTPSPWG